MPGDRTYEPTVNVALGEVLGGMLRNARVLADRTGDVLEGGGQPDVLVLEEAGWPVVVEAKLTDHAAAEKDANERLGRRPVGSAELIETAIALVYPPEMGRLEGEELREALRATDALEYALYTHVADDERGRERLPESGWLRGSAIELAMLIHRASTPARRVEALADVLVGGIGQAADLFSKNHPTFGEDRGAQIAEILAQSDEGNGQTRRMAMAIIATAFIFHESLAQAGFRIEIGGRRRAVKSIESFVQLEILRTELLAEWGAILERNYWPIFASAKEMLSPDVLPIRTVSEIAKPLVDAARRLVLGGVTRSHDLTGRVVQRLIADRRFLATYYTRPESAALLAGLALPLSGPPGGADWSDAETLAAMQIGDFACGTGTLLSAAYSRLSLLHELHGGDPKALHGPMMKNGLVGLDVLNIAVHLTATMLASAHPDTPFDGECLLTMPYGAQEDGSVAVGSLELLAENVQPSLIGQAAAATTAGGRQPEEVRELVTRVSHGKFDLVISNPPFTRSTNHEGAHEDVPLPAYAAFETTTADQTAMGEREKLLARNSPASGNAGMASYFTELSHRKIRRGGALAHVLPLSALSGQSWRDVRKQWRSGYGETVVVTVAGAGSYDASFSADTGMAECLLVTTRSDNDARRSTLDARRSTLDARRSTLGRRALFVVLTAQPTSTVRGELIAAEIRHAMIRGEVNRLEEGPLGPTPLFLGDEHCGHAIDCPLPEGDDPWPLVGIADVELAQVASRLGQGNLALLGKADLAQVDVPITLVGEIAGRGPVHRDINGEERGGAIRGPFTLIKPAITAVPTYPMLWAHDSKKERRLVVEPDSEGQIKSVDARFDQSSVNEKAATIWATATRAHYNGDLRFNSQSLIVAMTPEKCIGGTAWPSVIFENPEHEYAFSLWCNSTLGLLLHWWVSNKTQSGRGRMTVTGIPRIPTLDVRALSEEQHARAEQAFERLRGERFLPFDQIDEDDARARLDRALLVDVLGLPESLCAEDGPLALLRRKLAAEPQIHGGKRSRVKFTETGETTTARRER